MEARKAAIETNTSPDAVVSEARSREKERKAQEIRQCEVERQEHLRAENERLLAEQQRRQRRRGRMAAEEQRSKAARMKFACWGWIRPGVTHVGLRHQEVAREDGRLHGDSNLISLIKLRAWMLEGEPVGPPTGPVTFENHLYDARDAARLKVTIGPIAR